MAQHDLLLEGEQSRTNWALDAQAAVQALASLMTGAVGDIVETYPNQLLADTTSGHLLKRTNADDAWDPIAPLDQRIIASAAASDTYAIALAPVINAYKQGCIYRFKANVPNTGAATLNINGVAAWDIKKFVGGVYVALDTNDIIANHVCLVIADTTASVFLLLNPSLPAQAIPGYFSRLNIKNNSGAPDTQTDVDADSIVVTDSATYKNLLAVDLTINCATTGANGLDVGSLAASTHYYVYAIAKADGTQAGLVSLSATAPTMPAGYTFKRLVGAVITDSSSHFLRFRQFDSRVYYPNGCSVANTVLTAGAATSLTSVGLSGFVPPNIAKTVLINMEVQQVQGWALGTGFVSCDNAGIFFDIAVETADNANGRSGAQISVPIITSQTIYYKVYTTGGSVALFMSVSGFELNI